MSVMQTVKFISLLGCIILMGIGWLMKSPGICTSIAILFILIELANFIHVAHKFGANGYRNNAGKAPGNQFKSGIFSSLSANIIPFSFIAIALAGEYPWLNSAGFIVWIGMIIILLGYVVIVKKFIYSG